MLKSRKDLMYVYMIRNAIATFLVALSSFVISFMKFYDCLILEGIERVFLYNVYTTLYFVLLWLFDYLIFEMSKIIYDDNMKNITFFMMIVMALVAVILYSTPVLDVFRYNWLMLCTLIAMRMIKQIYKKRPNNGLK